MNTSKIVGPALAGVLLKFLGPNPSYAVLTLCSLAALALFLLVRRPIEEQARVAGSPLANLLDGLVYVTRHRTILAVLLITIFMNCLVFPYMQLLPVMARDILRVGPIELGWLAAADGIGALLGLPLIARTRRGGPHGWIYILGSLLMATTLLAFALSPWYGLALLLLIIGGVGHAGFGTMQGTILLTQSDPAMRGRVLGALTLAIGASPFGALLMGLLAERWDASVAIALCAATACATVLLVGALAPSLRRAGRRGV
jgi:predicted MFS family arabinose efflux permease